MFEKMNERSRKEQYISRRKFWMEAGMGIGGLALLDLLSQDNLLAAECVANPGGKVDSPLAPKPPHFKPRAKSVISLFMSGGVSHMDTFDYKPALEKYNRMPMEGHGDIKVRQGYPGPLMKSPFTFKQYGQSGAWVSEIFPNIATIVDELAFMHSCQGLSNDHVISHYEWNTGSIQMGFPSVGAWVTYGLGSENQNLPGYVVVLDAKGGPYAGPPNWQNGFLPAAYQGTVFRSKGDPILDLSAPGQSKSGRVSTRWICSMRISTSSIRVCRSFPRASRLMNSRIACNHVRRKRSIFPRRAMRPSSYTASTTRPAQPMAVRACWLAAWWNAAYGSCN
jgi:hypothetical protein